MRIAMPAAVLAGGASRRMGRDKGALPWGAGTLAQFQTARLAAIFDEVWLVAKRAPEYDPGPARLLFDGTEDSAAIHGLARALREAEDRVFVLAVDLPAIPEAVLRLIGRRGLDTESPALVPLADGRLQPLAAVWRRRVLEGLETRRAAGQLSLHGLAEVLGAEILPEEEWLRADPSGNSFLNANTLVEYASLRDRA
jgi:molybdopterin-guanine dinucleotide biosynthesis protein A